MCEHKLNAWMFNAKSVLCIFILLISLSLEEKLILSDVTATVDRLFSFPIHNVDHVTDITVVESGHTGLPPWLSYNSQKGTLEGVPHDKDRGTYVISVDGDMFAITVRSSTQSEVAQPLLTTNTVLLCKPIDSVTRVSVALNIDTDSLSPSQKVRLIENLSTHLSLNSGQVSLRAERQQDMADQSSALVSGLGDQKRRLSQLGSLLYWVVGCGAVKSHQMEILERLQSSAKDGSLSRSIGHGVNSWQVAIDKPSSPNKRRLKRQVVVTESPTPAIPVDTTTAQKPGVSPIDEVTTPAPSKVRVTPPPPPTTPPPPLTNKPPVFREDIDRPIKLKMFSGQLFTWAMPHEYFKNPGGGKLRFSMLDFSTYEPLPWLKMDETGLVQAVPMSDVISDNKFVIRAKNSRGAFVDVQVTVDVQDAQLDAVTQLYKMRVGPSFTGTAQEMFSLVTVLQNDILSNNKRVDLGTVRIRSVNIEEGYIEMAIAYPDAPPMTCPNDANSEDLRRLRKANNITLKVDNGFTRVNIYDITSKPLHPCENRAPSVNDERSIRKKFLSKLKARKGVIFEVKVPNALFLDWEDINLKYMQKLELLVQGVELAETSWVYLDKGSNTILGLPWDIDRAKTFQYSLVATDSANKTATFDIDIEVMQKSHSYEPTNLFTLTIDQVYSKFANNRQVQIRLYDKLNKAFGKSGQPSIVVKSISKGSVVVAFHVFDTETSPKGQADCDKVKGHVDSVFDDDNELKRSFTDNFSGFTLKEVTFAPEGQCKGQLEPRKGQLRSPVSEEAGDEPDSMTYVIVIIPVVIVVIVLIVIIVVIVLRRKKQANHDISKANGTYIESGVPVVFDEDIKTMDQEQPAVTDPLLEESTPQPPAYPQNGNPEAAPLNAHKADEPEQRYPTPPVSEHDDTDR